LATYDSLRRACARFDSFQVDLSSNELFRSGVRVPIQEHWIYFNTERPDAIWKVAVEGGAAVRLTGEGEGRGGPQESVDGTRVFFYRVEGGAGRVWSAYVNGGEERPVAGVPADAGWVPSRTGAYFIKGAPRHYSLNYFDIGTQKIHKIADFPYLFALLGAQPLARRPHFSFLRNRALGRGHHPGGRIPVDRMTDKPLCHRDSRLKNQLF
jgi:hypothetical protein